MTLQTVGMRVLMGMALWGLAEIAAFVVVGAWIGVLGVLALVLGSGVLGVALLRGMGRGVVRLDQVMVLRPEAGMLKGVAALLLILPGLLTDLAGLVLLLPGVQRRIVARFVVVDPGDDVLEGEAVEVEVTRLPSGWTKP